MASLPGALVIADFSQQTALSYRSSWKVTEGVGQKKGSLEQVREGEKGRKKMRRWRVKCCFCVSVGIHWPCFLLAYLGGFCICWNSGDFGGSRKAEISTISFAEILRSCKTSTFRKASGR